MNSCVDEPSTINTNDIRSWRLLRYSIIYIYYEYIQFLAVLKQFTSYHSNRTIGVVGVPLVYTTVHSVRPVQMTVLPCAVQDVQGFYFLSHGEQINFGFRNEKEGAYKTLLSIYPTLTAQNKML